jgi:hypothetical protein
MTEEKKPNRIVNAFTQFGKRFRGRKDELPPGWGYCDVCVKKFPKEDLHHVIQNLGDPHADLYICDTCIENPPSTWIKHHKYKSGH